MICRYNSTFPLICQGFSEIFIKIRRNFLHRLSSVQRKRHSGAEERTAKLRKGGKDTQSSGCRSRQERTCCTGVSELRNYNRAETVLTHDGRFCAGGPGGPCPAHVYSCKAKQSANAGTRLGDMASGRKALIQTMPHFGSAMRDLRAEQYPACSFSGMHRRFAKGNIPQGASAALQPPEPLTASRERLIFGAAPIIPPAASINSSPTAEPHALSQRFAVPYASVRILSPPPHCSRPPACFPKCRTGELAPHRSPADEPPAARHLPRVRVIHPPPTEHT